VGDAPSPVGLDRSGALTTSVVVVTYERPTFVRRCLEQLLSQTVQPIEIIVVDSSASDRTARLVAEEFPSVQFAVCPAGVGATATARNIGYRLASGEVLAFVDDDAFAEPDWLERLLPFYEDPTVGGVGGRQIRKQPGELDEGLNAIGLLLPNGTMTGNFAADPGHAIDVYHLLGANMSFRRSAIDQVGGIREGYSGTCIREETDISFRVSRAGYRLVYTPDAVVEHVAGPYAKGQRFDLRYAYWAQKNHLILLIRNFGLRAPIVRAFLASSVSEASHETAVRLSRSWGRARGRDGSGAIRAAGAAVLRALVVVAGSITGVLAGCSQAAQDSRT
jgi:GT2 family glycosyltransferase